MFRKPTLSAIASGALIIILGIRPLVNAQPAGSPAATPSAKLAVGAWQYEFAIKAWGTRSEGEWGTLTHDGIVVDAKSFPTLDVNDYVHTPWGTLYWGGISKFPWGAHGWFPTPITGKAGKRVTPSNAPAKECVLAEADDGSTVQVTKGTRIFVRLPQSRALERNWKLADLSGDVLSATPQPLSRRSPLPRGWGPDAWVQYSFLAERLGKAALVFEHQAGPAGSAPAAKKTRITIDVVEVISPPLPPAKGNDVSLSSSAPHGKVTVPPGGTVKVHVSLAGGTGYKLHLVPPKDNIAALVGTPTIEGPTSKLFGAPSIHHFEFRIGSSPPSEFRIVFHLRRPGQSTGPEYDVAVNVLAETKKK
ncbi:MAG TPA: protease inhibitor I42 family protein [Gemmataceae bacterium]|nr:protease inhibitor I42 family protein [Gemmataceae bacterium]